MKKGTHKKYLFLVMLVLLTLVLTSCGRKTAYTKSELIASLPSSNLSSLESVYNGIADISKDGKVYHIHYQAKIKLGANFRDLDIRLDDGKKTLVIIAPEVSIVDIIVDPSSFDFIPSNPTVEIDEIMDACENDVREATQKDYRLQEKAQDSFISVIEGLLRPLIKDTEYSASWLLKRIKVVDEVKQWAD